MVLRFVAVLLTALALVPTGAHLAELINKMPLSGANYLIVQQVYRGWAAFGVILIAALMADAALLYGVRRLRGARLLAAGGVFCMAASLAVFFVATYPVNVSTANWTVLPDDWQQLRRQWEMSHAANALLIFCALCFTLAAGLARDTTID